MQQTPSSHRVHIAFFGRCNSGKSSLINALTGQEVAIVSEMAGTTTDSVLKPIELPGVGATILIDTPGLDDNTPLGNQRKAQSLKALDKTDIAVVLFHDEDTSVEEALITQLSARKTPIIGVISKCDTMQNRASLAAKVNDIIGSEPIALSTTTREGIEQLLARLASLSQQETRLITEGLCSAGDMVVLVMPQDAQAPKGRLIKPQVEVLRELLDRGCNTLCCTPEGLKASLNTLNTPPQLIITDSQAFNEVNKQKPESSVLTSFSILFARYKGDIRLFVEGAKVLEKLTASSRILIAEACTHTPQHEYIGRVKLPRLLRKQFGDTLQIDIVSGADYPEDLTSYDLVIHCGACMFNRKHVLSRIERARQQGVAITNYGVILAALTGVLDRVKVY